MTLVARNRNLARRIASGGGWAIVGRVGASVFALVTNAILARLLDQSNYGQYFLVSSLVLICASLAQVGVNQTLVKFIAGDDGCEGSRDVEDYVKGAYIIVILGAIAVSLVMVGALEYHALDSIWRSQLNPSKILLALWIASLALQSLTAEVFRGFQIFRQSAIFGGLTSAAILLGGLVLCYKIEIQVNLEEVVILTAVSLTASNVLSLFSVKNIIKTGLFSKTKSKIISVVVNITSSSWPVLLATLATFILTQADIWIIGHYLLSSDVATYSAASKLAQTCMLVTSLSYSVLPPFIVGYISERKTQELQTLVQIGASACSIAVLPLACMMLLFPGTLLEVMYGASYRDADGILIPIVIGLLFNTLTGMRGYLLILSGHQKIQLLIATINGVINLAACSTAAQLFGREGVAWAVCFSMILGCIIEMIVVKRLLQVWTYATLKEARSVIKYCAKQLNLVAK